MPLRMYAVLSGAWESFAAWRIVLLEIINRMRLGIAESAKLRFHVPLRSTFTIFG